MPRLPKTLLLIGLILLTTSLVANLLFLSKDHHLFSGASHLQSAPSFEEELVEGNDSQKKRIAKIDLAILRVAIFEMIYRKDIPPIVSINEAIDLSKQFSNADAKRFINGILDRVKEQVGRDARKAE